MIKPVFGQRIIKKISHNLERNWQPLQKVLSRSYAVQKDENFISTNQIPTAEKDKNIELHGRNFISELLNVNPTFQHQIGRYSTDVKNPEPTENIARYNYNEEVEIAINEQILCEFEAAYTYLSMACYFGRTNVGLKGAEKFFREMCQEEHGHAVQFANYQLTRGGHVQLGTISIVDCADGCTLVQSLEIAVKKERIITDKLMQVYTLAEKYADIRTQDLIVAAFIKEQLDSIRQIGHLLTRARKAGTSGLSQYFFDMELASATGH